MNTIKCVLCFNSWFRAKNYIRLFSLPICPELLISCYLAGGRSSRLLVFLPLLYICWLLQFKLTWCLMTKRWLAIVVFPKDISSNTCFILHSTLFFESFQITWEQSNVDYTLKTISQCKNFRKIKDGVDVNLQNFYYIFIKMIFWLHSDLVGNYHTLQHFSEHVT